MLVKQLQAQFKDKDNMINEKISHLEQVIEHGSEYSSQASMNASSLPTSKRNEGSQGRNPLRVFKSHQD